jgi:hypothetical protein
MPKRTFFLCLVCVLELLLIAADSVPAQNGIDLKWWTVDGGGSASSGGGYGLSGTIGQADSGSMSGGHYAVNAGFWNTYRAVNPLQLPVVLR